MVDDGDCDELRDDHPKKRIPPPKIFSKGQSKKVMKKIKEFFNPMVKCLSKDSKDKEDKISLTYNSKRGCLIQLEKKDGKIETLVDYFTSQNNVEGHSSSGICGRGKEEKSSLLGGGKKRSKSEEARRQRNRREARANKLSNAETQEQRLKKKGRIKNIMIKIKKRFYQTGKIIISKIKERF